MNIVVIKNANLPQFRFEWHPQTRKVYVMPMPTAEGQRIEADVLAEHADNHAQAFGFVQTWSRGYHAGRKAAGAISVLECAG